MSSIRLVLALVVLVWPFVARGHVGNFVYAIYEVPTADVPDLHDGTLQDWEEAVPQASIVTADLARVTGTGAQPDDFAARVYLAWNHASGRMFFGAEILDDFPVASEDPAGDMVFFHIDGNHDGGQTVHRVTDPELAEETRLLDYRGAQSYGGVILDDPDRQEFYSSIYVRSWMLQEPYADMGASVDEVYGLSVVEMAVTPWDQLDQLAPEASVPSRLVPEEIVGFQVVFLDSDPGSFEQITVAPWTDPWSASDLLDAVLVPCDRLDCSRASGTSIEPSSWARVKAGLR